MRTGLVMEGGAARGMFTSGVIDVFMENDIAFDASIGVSAGAVYGCNYASKQIGRSIRYSKKYAKDKRFGSFRNLIRTGDYYEREFAYREIPLVRDPFDYKEFEKNEFYAVVTDVKTGKAIYHKCTDGRGRDMEWLRASASMPVFAKIVKVDGYELLDGGIADSIPVRAFQEMGFDRNVVILTRPADYRKKKNGAMPLLNVMYKKYPEFLQSMADRHIRYNETLDYIEQQEAEGKILVIRPPAALELSKLEHDPEKLEKAYQLGRSEALRLLDDVRRFLAGN